MKKKVQMSVEHEEKDRKEDNRLNDDNKRKNEH